MPKDYYKILGISRNASPEEIKVAFRKLAHQYHPDKKGGDASKFKEINEAYQVLLDTEKRRQYDEYGTVFERAHPGTGQGFGAGPFGFEGTFGGEFGDIGDIFSDMFGFGRGRRRASRRGADIAVDIELDFREAAFGVARDIQVNKTSLCDVCSGSGAEPGAVMTTCRECGGSGEIRKSQRTVFGSFATAVACAACGGQGEVPERICKHCDGRGSVRKTVTLSVEIPSGIDDGETVRLRGQGEAGERGATPGDLYITVHVRPDARFIRKGRDIFSTITIPFTTAALGGSVDVQTLDGAVALKIPEGTRAGTEFRIRGKGIGGRRGGRGDHIVAVEVTVPNKLTREQKKLLEELKRVGL